MESTSTDSTPEVEMVRHSNHSPQASSDQALNDLLAALPEMFPGVQEVPLANIRPNPGNPGPPITDQQIQELGQNIAEAGLLNHIKVRLDKANPFAGLSPEALAKGECAQIHPENPRLRADGQPWTVGDFNYVILAGENRYRAFDYLKRESIPGSILNPTAKEAVKITHLDNDVRDRGWWAAYQTIEQYIQADPNLTQRQVAVELKMNKDKVTRALSLLPLLNTEARALIVRDADNSNKGIWGISDRAAAQLAGLGPGTGLKPGVKAAGVESQKLWPYPPIPPETQDLVRRTLAVAYDHQMTEAQVKRLVEGVKGGQQPEDFSKQKDERQSTVGSPSPSAEASGDRQSTANPQPGEEKLSKTGVAASLTPAYSAGTPRNDSKLKEPKVPTMGNAESLLWDGLAGVSIVSRIRAKIKKGERPTWWEFLILAGATLLVPIKWMGHLAWKALKWVARELFHRTRQAARGLARLVGGAGGKVLEWVLPWVFLFVLGWLAYQNFFNHLSVGGAIKRKFSVLSSEFWVKKPAKTEEQPKAIEPSPFAKATGDRPSTATAIEPPRRQVHQEGLKPVVEKQNITASSPPKPINPGTQPWNSDIEDRSYLEAEIAAVPGPGWIKAFPFEPVPMSGDMSIRRLGDLQDPEKYSLIVGHDKQHVLSVSPAMTGFTLTYGDGLPIGGFLGGPAKIDFYWEDVKAIHCDEIKNGTQTLFQLGLVVNGLKKPFIVQCPTKEGLGHLVSAFEFWIDAAGAGRKAPVTGMPYLFQGLMLDGQCRVKLVWAGSPIDLGAIQPGDGVWSWDADTKQPAGKANLESALESPGPGRHNLYVATSDAWGSGPLLGNFYKNRLFNPKRQKMELVVP